jgi:hypothetical protein
MLPFKELLVQLTTLSCTIKSSEAEKYKLHFRIPGKCLRILWTAVPVKEVERRKTI